MKINSLKVAFMLPFLFAGLVITGCSNEDIVEDKPQEGMRKVSFSISEEDYEPAEDVAGTRAAAPTKPKLQDLGDGWLAEVSLEPDTTHTEEAKTAEVKTRAIYGPAHYTIQAYQGGVKKGELKGTFQGSTFTPDAGTAESIFLPHGTYDFVCFNDKVSANGTQFTVHRTDASTARFTVQRGVVINQDPKQYVAFEMKHAGALVGVDLRFVNCNIEAVYTRYVYLGMAISTIAEARNPAERLKYKVETAADKIPETMIYDFATDTYTFPTMRQATSNTYTVTTGQSTYTTLGDKTYVSHSDDFGDSWLPTTDCANLKLTFTFGELYGRSLVGKTITVPTHKQVEANKTYRVVINVLMGYMYLFSDGTAGPLANNPGKTPVGVVVEPYRRIAVALKDAQPTYYGSNKWSISTNSDGNSATSYKDLFGYFSNNRGEVSSYPLSNHPAAELALNYYQTAGYGNSYMGSGSWYVPSLDDFLLMGVSLGKLPNQTPGSRNYPNNFSYLIPTYAPATGFGASVVFPSMDMTRFNKAFTDVGGTAPSGSYWTSNECQDGGNYMQGTMFIGAGYSFQLTSKTNTAQVRPFIRY